jgi:hypothetical protein
MADALVEEIHIIAYHYHWSKREILELTKVERDKFIELISRQVKAENGDEDEFGEDTSASSTDEYDEDY